MARWICNIVLVYSRNMDVGWGVMTEGHEYATEEQIYEKLKKTCGYS